MRLRLFVDECKVRPELCLEHSCRIAPHGKSAASLRAGQGEGREDDEAPRPEAAIEGADIGGAVGCLDEE